MTERVRMMMDSGSRSSVNACFVAQPTRHTTGSTKMAICAQMSRCQRCDTYEKALSHIIVPQLCFEHRSLLTLFSI